MTPPNPHRRGTYSIVARDPSTGELGVAVQSHWFSVGSIVPWARAGIGAVATQSIAEPAYGPRLLARLESGEAPAAALAGELDGDELARFRQVAVIDAGGDVAAHTGEGCMPDAGHEGGSALGAIWSAGMMLDHLGHPAAARDITDAIASVLAKSDIRPATWAATATTAEFTDRLIELLEAFRRP